MKTKITLIIILLLSFIGYACADSTPVPTQMISESQGMSIEQAKDMMFQVEVVWIILCCLASFIGLFRLIDNALKGRSRMRVRSISTRSLSKRISSMQTSIGSVQERAQGAWSNRSWGKR